MEPATHFNGLTMPVFTAFGWAGQETAVKFALSQLEQFIKSLHSGLSRAARAELAFSCLSEANQTVYLSVDGNVESDAHSIYHARPVSLELQMVISDTAVLAKGLKRAEKDPAKLFNMLNQLEEGWSLRVQQMQVDEDSGEAAFYQDLYKDDLSKLDEAACGELFSKAAYLNGEDRWITPIYFSQRLPSERAAAMGLQIIEVMSEKIDQLLPVLTFLSGRTARKSGRKVTQTIISGIQSTANTKEGKKAAAAPPPPKPEDNSEQIHYVADLKPLHLRRGFINLTPKHWPFFAINARTETRPVVVAYGALKDSKSTVWRLQPTDQARLVLGPNAHDWLGENFMAGEQVEVIAKKVDDSKIEISLSKV